MATNLGICNRALIKLGVEPISSLSSDDKAAILCNSVFDDLRDQLISDHLWNFSIKRASLALLASTPEWEWSHEFQLPTDSLGVTKCGVGNQDIPYVVEEGKLRANSDTVNIKYRSRVTTAGTFSRPFTEALVWLIADEISYALVQSRSFRADIHRDATNAIIDARNRDAQEGTPEQHIPDTWLDSRGTTDIWDL